MSIVNYNPNYHVKKLSIRIPCQDEKWNGIFFKNPITHSFYLVLENCAKKRKDKYELQLAGKSKSRNQGGKEKLPPYLYQLASLMSSRSIKSEKGQKTERVLNEYGEECTNILNEQDFWE